MTLFRSHHKHYHISKTHQHASHQTRNHLNWANQNRQNLITHSFFRFFIHNMRHTILATTKNWANQNKKIIHSQILRILPHHNKQKEHLGTRESIAVVILLPWHAQPHQYASYTWENRANQNISRVSFQNSQSSLFWRIHTNRTNSSFPSLLETLALLLGMVARVNCNEINSRNGRAMVIQAMLRMVIQVVVVARGAFPFFHFLVSVPLFIKLQACARTTRYSITNTTHRKSISTRRNHDAQSIFEKG